MPCEQAVNDDDGATAAPAAETDLHDKITVAPMGKVDASIEGLVPLEEETAPEVEDVLFKGLRELLR